MARRLPSPRLAALSARQFRYVATALFLIVVLTISLPRFSRDKLVHSDHLKFSGSGNDQGKTRIQYAFPEEEMVHPGHVRIQRQQKIREAFFHAWNGYKDHAWLHDELMPVSGGNKDPFSGWAATLVDSLDSLYILDLKPEFENALKALEAIDFTKPGTDRVPVFETTIRYLGGLLGAYDVSEGKYPILLKKADELGEFLFQAFNTKTGIPVPYFHWENPKAKLEGESNVLLAQIGENE